MSTIFYMHGWRSTPHQKAKAIQAHYPNEKVVGISLAYRLEADIKAIKAQIDPILADGGNVIVCGTSMGGFMTLALMHEYPTMPFRIAFIPINPSLNVISRMKETMDQTVVSYDGSTKITIDQSCYAQALSVQNRVLNFSQDDLDSINYHTIIGTEDELLTYDLYRKLYTDNYVTYIKSGHRLEDLTPLFRIIDGFLMDFPVAQ